MNRTNLNIVANKLECMARYHLNKGWSLRGDYDAQDKCFQEAAKCYAGAQMISRMALSVNA